MLVEVEVGRFNLLKLHLQRIAFEDVWLSEISEKFCHWDDGMVRFTAR